MYEYKYQIVLYNSQLLHEERTWQERVLKATVVQQNRPRSNCLTFQSIECSRFRNNAGKHGIGYSYYVVSQCTVLLRKLFILKRVSAVGSRTDSMSLCNDAVGMQVYHSRPHTLGPSFQC